MHIVEDTSNEELALAARSAHAAGDSAAFRATAGQLLERSRQFIAGKITQKLRPANLLALSEDAAAEIQRRILEDLQAPRLKRGMDTVFHLYLNETCRDVLETFLRREGIPVPTRHKARAGAAPAQPQIVPRRHLVSLDAPVDDDEDMTLGDTVSVADEQLPETLVLDRLERLDVMRTLPPEQRLMVAIYGDVVDRKLKTHQVAAQRGLSVADVKRHYNEACRILQRAKERNQ